MNPKNLQSGDELILEFRGGELFYTSSRCVSYVGEKPFHFPIRSGVRWRVRIHRLSRDTGILTVHVIQYDHQGQMPYFQDEIPETFGFIRIEKPWYAKIAELSVVPSNARPTPASGAPNPSPRSSPSPSPKSEKPSLPLKRFNYSMEAEIDLLEFLDGVVSIEDKKANGYGPVKLEIRHEAIHEAFGTVKPYIKKSVGKKSITIDAEIEVGQDLKAFCISARSEVLEKFLLRGIRQIRTDLLEESIFQQQELGFADVESLIKPWSKLLEKELSPIDIIGELIERRSPRHANELTYLAERHLGRRMKLRFQAGENAFLFLLEGSIRYHLVLEVFDRTNATYVWHCIKNSDALKARIAEVTSLAEELSEGKRQIYKRSKPVDFDSIDHLYMDDAKGNFEAWKMLLEAACD